MDLMARRKFLQGTVGMSSAAVFSLYPQNADAWFWFIARALVSFSGRTVGRKAVQTLVRSGARAAQPVRSRAGIYAKKVRPYYPVRAEEKSYPFAEHVGKELGQYGAESAFDYLYNLNNNHYGGAAQVVVVEKVPENNDDPNGGAGFSTGNGLADFHVSHITALDTCSERLQRSRLTPSEITGILYPVSSSRNNFSSLGYRRTGHVSYRTAFGYVKIKSYPSVGRDVRADVFAQDEVTGRYFKWDGVLA